MYVCSTKRTSLDCPHCRKIREHDLFDIYIYLQNTLQTSWVTETELLEFPASKPSRGIYRSLFHSSPVKARAASARDLRCSPSGLSPSLPAKSWPWSLRPSGSPGRASCHGARLVESGGFTALACCFANTHQTGFRGPWVARCCDSRCDSLWADRHRWHWSQTCLIALSRCSLAILHSHAKSSVFLETSANRRTELATQCPGIDLKTATSPRPQRTPAHEAPCPQAVTSGQVRTGGRLMGDYQPTLPAHAPFSNEWWNLLHSTSGCSQNVSRFR